MQATNCSQCDTEFKCGHPHSCWCSQLPRIMPPEEVTGCLCQDCLIQNLHKQLQKYLESHTAEETAEKLAPFRDNVLVENLDYTVQNGLWIFSKWYLLRRGYCCNQGCAHCPY